MSKLLGLNRSYLAELETGRRPVKSWIVNKAESFRRQSKILDSARVAQDVRGISSESSQNAIHELATPENVELLTKAFRLNQTDPDELMSLFEKVVMISNNAPPALAKYFVLLRVTLTAELHRRMKKS